jgi:hypothetical protein
MQQLVRATIVDADPGRYRATVRIEHDGRVISDVRVNAGTAVEGLTTGHPCLVAVLDDDEALLVTTRIEED